jgi:hypothetical protein
MHDIVIFIILLLHGIAILNQFKLKKINYI